MDRFSPPPPPYRSLPNRIRQNSFAPSSPSLYYHRSAVADNGSEGSLLGSCATWLSGFEEAYDILFISLHRPDVQILPMIFAYTYGSGSCSAVQDPTSYNCLTGLRSKGGSDKGMKFIKSMGLRIMGFKYRLKLSHYFDPLRNVKISGTKMEDDLTSTLLH
ncbi:hypothetical protein L1887_25834 [Cichorium endivia]|nr:hypothetical protein L1887_25834 [Cichorium endivia]